MTTPEQRRQHNNWESNTPICRLSHHDKTVYRIAQGELKRGAKSVAIGQHIESAGKMVRLLQRRYPDRAIRVGISQDIDLLF